MNEQQEDVKNQIRELVKHFDTAVVILSNKLPGDQAPEWSTVLMGEADDSFSLLHEVFPQVRNQLIERLLTTDRGRVFLDQFMEQLFKSMMEAVSRHIAQYEKEHQHQSPPQQQKPDPNGRGFFFNN